MLAAQHTAPDPFQSAGAGPAQLSPAKAAQELRCLATALKKADIQLKLMRVPASNLTSPFPAPPLSVTRLCVLFRRANGV